MISVDGLDEFDDQVVALEASLGTASGVAAGFGAELTKMRDTLGATGRDVDGLSRGIGRGLRRAFDGLVFDGRTLSDALQDVAQSMLRVAYGAAVRPVAKQFGGMIAEGVSGALAGALPFAAGGGFAQGRVMPFARGGVVTGPTAFAMRGGLGLMGEAGPEAIMPLARGADGRLGVAASGGGRAVNVVMNISTPDVEGFRRSQGQIAAQVGRALGRGQRNR